MHIMALAILIGALVVGDRWLTRRVAASTASNITSVRDDEETLYSLYLAYRGSGRRTQVA